MFGLTVRWSLEGVRKGTAEELRDFVRTRSLERFTGMEGLRFKTWRMVEGEWFEGTYVWATAAARDAFAEADRAGMADSPGTRIIGTPPVLHESFEVVGVAGGAGGFLAGRGPGPGSADRGGATPAS